MVINKGNGNVIHVDCRKATKKPKPKVTALAPKGSIKNGSSMRLAFHGWLSAYAPSRPKLVAITTVSEA